MAVTYGKMVLTEFVMVHCLSENFKTVTLLCSRTEEADYRRNSLKRNLEGWKRGENGISEHNKNRNFSGGGTGSSADRCVFMERRMHGKSRKRKRPAHKPCAGN